MLWLKQSTSVTVKVGPFLDSSDGDTEETALSIAQADIRLSKNGGALAQSNNAAGAAHDANGIYGVPLDTTDTNTLGTLRVYIHKSGALPVWQDFMVIPANVWDSLFGADYLQVDVTQINGNAPAAANLAGNIARLLGLSQENIYQHTFAYTGDKLTSSKVDIYDSKANAQTHDGSTGIVAKYTQTITWSGEEMTSFGMVQDS